MKIRFGYVANATCLWEASPAKTLTFKRFSMLGQEQGMKKLLEVTKQNIENTRRILYYNTAHQIEVYRLSSSIVPLATHPDIEWDFVTPFANEWRVLGDWIKQHQLRLKRWEWQIVPTSISMLVGLMVIKKRPLLHFTKT
jgi:UV DNA damage endonuclease